MKYAFSKSQKEGIMKKTAIFVVLFLFCSQTYAGWFWKPAVVARGRINKIIADHGLTMEDAYDFGDGSSEALTQKAWDAFKMRNFEAVFLYVDKCMEQYTQKALEEQKTLCNFSEEKAATQHKTLNDVGTCLFIKGKALKAKGQPNEARKAFTKIINNYPHAQYWDADGEFYWKLAERAQAILEKL